jgi:hypothetical protein
MSIILDIHVIESVRIAEQGSVLGIGSDYIVLIDTFVLFLTGDGEQESVLEAIVLPNTSRIPGFARKSSNDFISHGVDQDQSVSNVLTFSMERRSLKVLLGSSVQFLELHHFFIFEKPVENLHLMHLSDDLGFDVGSFHTKPDQTPIQCFNILLDLLCLDFL